MKDMEMRVEGYMMGKRGDARPLAEHWASWICSAVDRDGKFTDPELEAEYQAWKAERDGRKLQ